MKSRHGFIWCWAFHRPMMMVTTIAVRRDSEGEVQAYVTNQGRQCRYGAWVGYVQREIV